MPVNQAAREPVAEIPANWQWQPATTAAWRSYIYETIAAQISAFSRYYDKFLQLAPLPHDTGFLFRKIENGAKSVVAGLDDLLIGDNKRALILLNGNFNYELDIQRLLSAIKGKLSRQSRLAVVAYNPYFSWLYQIAHTLGLRKEPLPLTFLTETDVTNLCRLSGYEVVQSRNVVYCPWKLFGIGQFFNAVLPIIPIIRQLSLSQILLLRPVIQETTKPSLSIIIPARNERGNIENACKRLQSLDGIDLEIIFVEGHSTDSTWEEIQRVAGKYSDRYKIKAFKQTGKGKSDAVRLGFSQATKELLVILDADLSVPPELLGRFYDAYCAGLADFVNGSRLLYPIEGKAMRPLNKLGNIFFSKALSWVLGCRLGDTLCGTKLFSRDSYRRFVQWRNDFGDFDPFGDFELLFPAATLGLGIVDVPIRYRDREYGQTNISRFRHGLMLLKMTFVGLTKIKLGRTKGF